MLVLTDVEKSKRDACLQKWGYHSGDPSPAECDIEEDCCGSRSFYYVIKPSGIGDTINGYVYANSCLLTKEDVDRSRYLPEYQGVSSTPYGIARITGIDKNEGS